MPVFNHTRKLIDNQEIDLDNLRIVLTNGYTFDATQVAATQVLAAQVSGNGWAAGGELIANTTVTVVDVNGAMIDGDNISVTATGGAIGPADGYAIIDATNGFPLAYTAFTAKTADAGTPFNVNFNANGIFRTTVTP